MSRGCTTHTISAQQRGRHLRLKFSEIHRIARNKNHKTVFVGMDVLEQTTYPLPMVYIARRSAIQPLWSPHGSGKSLYNSCSRNAGNQEHETHGSSHCRGRCRELRPCRRCWISLKICRSAYLSGTPMAGQDHQRTPTDLASIPWLPVQAAASLSE